MIRKMTVIAMAVVFGGMAASPALAKVFTGEIMDSACAKMGNHDAGYKMTGTHTPKECTMACVESGGSQFVLYNPARKTTYKLDNQTKPKQFAGERVRVTGTYDAGSKTIHVEKIEAAK